MLEKNERSFAIGVDKGAKGSFSSSCIGLGGHETLLFRFKKCQQFLFQNFRSLPYQIS